MIPLLVALLILIALSLLVGSIAGIMVFRGAPRATPVFWTSLILFFTASVVLIAKEISLWLALAPAIPATIIGTILFKTGRHP